MVKCGFQSRAAFINFWTPFRAAYNQGQPTIKDGLPSTKYGTHFFYSFQECKWSVAPISSCLQRAMRLFT